MVGGDEAAGVFGRAKQDPPALEYQRQDLVEDPHLLTDLEGVVERQLVLPAFDKPLHLLIRGLVALRQFASLSHFLDLGLVHLLR